MSLNWQRIRVRKIQKCAQAFSIIEKAIQQRLAVEDIPLTSNTATNLGKSPDSKLLSPKQISETLGVSEKTLANWRCSGTQGLPHIKVGSRIFYRNKDLHAFISNNSKQSTSHKV